MNSVVARLLTDLTASMRFAGSLNVDLNEITTNLVPFAKMHYLCPSLAPLGRQRMARSASSGSGQQGTANVIKGLFKEASHPSSQLITSQTSLKSSNVIACGLFLRGRNIPISDVNANVVRMQGELVMPSWNREGFKIGICDVPSNESPMSMLTLTNSTMILDAFQSVKERFEKLWRRKAMVHHYTNFIDEGLFGEALESLEDVMSAYKSVPGFNNNRNGGGGGGGGQRFRPAF